jgi:hypothetical protein
LNQLEAISLLSDFIYHEVRKIPGFPYPENQTFAHQVFLNFLILRYSNGVKTCLRHFNDRQMGFALRSMLDGISWVTANEGVQWAKAGALLARVRSTGLPWEVISIPDEKEVRLASLSPADWAKFWEDNGATIIASGIAGNVRAREIIESPPFIQLPSGWRSPDQIYFDLEKRLRIPGTRPKETVRISMDVIKVAPYPVKRPMGTLNLVDVAARLLLTVRSFQRL